MSRTRTENEAPSHKYFTQMLNIAEDDLDPFQYRLLAHYVRWTGHGGESDESIRATSKATKMSANKVRLTLEELESLKYIAVKRPTPQEARNGKTIHITILDRWMDNISRYQAVSEKTQPVLNLTQDTLKPVSNMTHPPVSNMTRLEEQQTEKQKEDSQSRKRSPLKMKFPSNIKSYNDNQVNGYFDLHTTEMTALIKAWHGEMYTSISEVSKLDARAYIEVHQELVRLHKPCEDYPALAKYTRSKEAWKTEKGGKVSVADMLKYVTDYKPASKKILYDDPAMDLSKPMPNILSKFQQDELERKARENG